VVYKCRTHHLCELESAKLQAEHCDGERTSLGGQLCEILDLLCLTFTTAISTHILKHYRITHPWRFLWDTDKYIDIQLQFIISYVAPCVTRFLLLPVPLLTVPRYCGTWVQYASEVLHHLNEEDSGENSAELFFHMRRGDCFRLLHTMGAKHHRHVFRHL